MSYLPASLLATLPLMELDLDNNSLYSIPASLFDRHINLEMLDLSGNHLLASGLPTNLASNRLSLDLCFDKLSGLPAELASLLRSRERLGMCSASGALGLSDCSFGCRPLSSGLLLS